MSRFLKCFIVLTCLLTMALFAAACADSSQPIPDQNQQPAPPEPEEQTLTISACYDYVAREIEIAAEKFKADHPGLEIVVETYAGDRERYKQQISIQLMGGRPADIIDATAFSEIDLANSNLLIDFYPLIEEDPDFTDDTYYMNVIDGMAFNGKVFVFPTEFSYSVLGVNNTLSRDLVERYQQYETITYRQALDLYLEFADPGLYLERSFDAAYVTDAALKTFVDFENQTCFFNTAEFIQFITDAKVATEPAKITRGELGWTYSANIYRADLLAEAQSYLFSKASNTDYWVFLPYTKGNVFTHYIPLVDNDGQALMMPRKRFCISEASQNKELAWEFIKYLTTPEANTDTIIYGFPIHRQLFNSYVTNDLTKAVEQWRSIDPVSGETEAVVADVMAKLVGYNELPMSYQNNLDIEAMADIIREQLYAFYRGTATAEQVATELQQKITVFMDEIQ